MARKLIDLTGATITFNGDKMTYERVLQFWEAVSPTTYSDLDPDDGPGGPGGPDDPTETERITLNFQGNVGNPEYLNTFFGLEKQAGEIIAFYGKEYYLLSGRYQPVLKLFFSVDPGDSIYLNSSSTIVDIQPSPEDVAFVKDPIFLSFIEDTCDIEGGVWVEVDNLKQKTASVPDGWSVPAGYMVYDNPCTINGMAASSVKLGYEEGAECADVIEVQTMARAMTHIYPDEPVSLSFENSTESEIYEYELQSFVLDNGGTISDIPASLEKGIMIGGNIIKVVRCGSDLVKEVYSGSDLIYRAFHNFIEGYSTYALPPQGNGSKLILPAYTGQNPPGEYFERYIYTEDGSEYYPGDEFIYPDDPEIAENWDIGFDNQETPYYYPHHFVVQYSSNPGTEEPEPGETCYGEVRVSGFDVNVAGNRVGVGNYMTFTGEYQQSFNYTINNVFRFGGFTNTTTGLSYVGVISLDAVQAYNIPSWRPNATNGAASAPSTVSVTQSRTITLNSSYVIQEWFCLYQYNGKYYV